METIELRSNIHKIVDGIQNEQLLKTIYDFLKIRETSKPGRLWDSLTEEQKQEVLAYDESEDENLRLVTINYYDPCLPAGRSADFSYANS